MKNLTYVGKSILRYDSFNRGKGETKYVGDLERKNMLYGKLVLSQEPNSDISIDKTEALKINGVKAIFTFEDIPKVKYNSNHWYPGLTTPADEYLLTNRPAFQGDRIALIIGESKKVVLKAMDSLKITYNKKNAVAALDSYINNKKQIAISKTFECGNSTTALDTAAFIIEDSGNTPKAHHGAIEPHACLAETDDNDNLLVYTPCQSVFQCQYHISKILKLPLDKVRVIKTHMGGSFGGKCQPVLEPICAFAAYALKQPIQLLTNRKESMIGMRTKNGLHLNIKTGVTLDGKITARQIDAHIDGGAYYTNADGILGAIGTKAFRLYDIKNQTFIGHTYYTNTTPGGSCRGYGSPQLHSISEVHMDHIANTLAMDPCEFRLKNLLSPYANDPIGGPNIGNGRIKECVDKGMSAFKWQEKKERLKEKNTQRYAYGIGMACGVHGNGYKGSNPDFTNIYIAIQSDGYVSLKVGVHEQGCGTLSSISQIAAEGLDIPVEKIILHEADTFISPYDSAGTHASRVTYVCGGGVQKAAEKLKNKIINYFCLIENYTPRDIQTKNGFIYSKDGKKKYSYGQLAIHMEKHTAQNLSEFSHYESPGGPGSYAASFVTVKIDRYTGHVSVLDCLIAQDVGKAINPTSVKGQITGGAQMAIGMALREALVWDKDGYIKIDSFSKYHMLNAVEMPDIEVLLVEDIEQTGPFGAKSVGELAAVTPTPAILNAINNALNTNIMDYPVTPEKILSAIQN